MLEVVYLSTGALKPYERNARKHEEKDIDAIVNSIKQFGFNDPIGVWGKDNLIVEGHGRLLAAQKLGMTDVPCIRLDELTDEQRRAYALIHNKLTTNTGFDVARLLEEIDSFQTIDMNKYGLGDFENIEEDLNDFFKPEDNEAEQPQNKNRIQFTITPEDQMEQLIDFLTENEIDYDER